MTKLVRDSVSYKELRLDSNNPRLPEEYIGKSQSELMHLFHKDYDLDELAASFLENGFFEAEALIIQDGTVIEGNRRLAALKYLLHDVDAQDADLPKYQTEETVSSSRLSELELLPVYIASADVDLNSYLGFHHINGPLQWSASSKARYITRRVDEIAKAGELNPFHVIAKEIGSNVIGVRNAYKQYALLRVARDDLGFRKQATYILDKRFGVWSRLTNSNVVFEAIGFNPNDSSYDSILAAVSDTDKINRVEFGYILSDLSDIDGKPPLLNDSRRASLYTRALAIPEAIKALRETRDYEYAKELIDGISINDNLEKALKRLNNIHKDIINGGVIDFRTMNILDSLQRLIASMKAAATPETLSEEQA